MVQLIVLYPYPSNIKEFEDAYTKHLSLLHEKLGIATNIKPYTITKFLPSPKASPPFYLMFSFPFESQEALSKAMASTAMQEVAADATRISTGGAPTILIGRQD
jgi:uncharacterized protein (TIGR02118 family)